jgi:Transposase DDE domain
MSPKQLQDDWEILLKFLPAGWETKATELGALVRRRKIDSPQTLLRLLLIHLADGKSLRTTAAYGQEAKLCNINDVALLHRLKASEQWFRWMSQELLREIKGPSFPDSLPQKFRVRVIDGTSITEPGNTGTDWRVHFSLQLSTLQCDSFTITGPEVGEDFQRFHVEAEDLLIADRGYCKRNGITHVLNQGGQVLVRFHSTNLPLFSREGQPLLPLAYFSTLAPGVCGDWDVWFRSPEDKHLLKGRLCAIKKNRETIERALKKLHRQASRKKKQLLPETLKNAEYVSVFTTVNRRSLKAEDILELYRCRWQIELVFKRLKTIIGLGHLPKHNPESCAAWLHGKMLVALLIERLYQEAEFFSPWGYPLQCTK